MAVENYGIFKGPIGALLLPAIPPWRIFMPAAVVLSLLALMCSRKLVPLVSLQLESLAVGVLVSYAMFWCQATGWSYQLHPAVGFGILLVSTVLVLTIEKELMSVGPGMQATLRACLYGAFCLAIVVPTAYVNVRKLRNAHSVPEWKGLCELIEHSSAPNEPVAFISLTSPYPAMAYVDRLPGTRYLVGWPLLFSYNGVHRSSDGSFPYRKGSEMTGEERRILKDIGNDIQSRAPRLIFIDRSETRAGFSVDHFLRKTGWLRRLIRGYVWTASYNAWDVYRRSD